MTFLGLALRILNPEPLNPTNFRKRNSSRRDFGGRPSEVPGDGLLTCSPAAPEERTCNLHGARAF